MTLQNLLKEFRGSIAGATTAPDRYACPEFQSWEWNKADLQSLWAQIKPKLKRDLDSVKLIDAKLHQMFEAFEAAHNEQGRDIAWELYALDVDKLR